MPAMALLTTVVLVFAEGARAQIWQNQINISMCSWSQLRANVIRNRIYLNGGFLWWLQGFSDGTTNPYNNGNANGILYYLDLSRGFDTTQNQTSLFGNLSEAGGVANNLAPNYIDGVMFANYDELYLYGGLLELTNSQAEPPANQVLGYERYQYGPYRSSWGPGFIVDYLSNNVTRYITNGAGVSAPSENLGFYFGGMRAQDWDPIYYGDGSANTTADTMISVNMSIMRQNEWYNDTLPSYVRGRANGELVWIPVSDSGVLVAIGGVVDPAVILPATNLTVAQLNASRHVSPSFMETVSVYDIASKTWFTQHTTGDIPPQLTMFCSVVATASDGSSHNIYIYGGTDGLDVEDVPSDDVYVLSLPSFTWIKVYSGQSRHGRSGHRCIKPYPDQMFVLGGSWVGSDHCLEGGIIQNFNLNSLRFQNVYDPALWTGYQVPDMIYGIIGGNSKGNASLTSPSLWTNSSLAQIFQTQYTKPISTWYPYNSTVSATPTASPTFSPSYVPKPRLRFPEWAGVVVGILLVFAIALVGCMTFLCRWRMRRSHTPALNSTGHGSGSVNGATALNATTTGPNISDLAAKSARIFKWMHSTSSAPASGKLDGSDAIASSRSDDSGLEQTLATTGPPESTELESSPVYEMHGSETKGRVHIRPVELPTPYNFSTPLSPGSESVAMWSWSPSAAESPAQTTTSPVLPEPQEPVGLVRLAHRRQVSSLSTTAPSMWIDGLVSVNAAIDG